jgi:hypothetical protein
LKDGFVVDSSDTEEAETFSSTEDEDEDESTEDELDAKEDDIVLEDIGSELSEESYDYDSDTNNEK